MKYSDLIPLTAALLNLALAVFVFASNWRAKINRVYLLWGICLAIWNFGTYQLFQGPFNPSAHDHAMHWAKFVQVGVIFLPIALLHLTILIVRVEPGRKVAVLYGLLSLLAILNVFSLFFVKGVHTATDGGNPDKAYAWYTTGGPGYYLFICLYTALCLSAIRIMLKQMAVSERAARTRILRLLMACCILILFGTNDILPIIGIDKYPVLHWPIYPLGSLAAIVYGIIAAHSILQYQLLDIHVTLGRMAARFVRLSFLLMMCLVLLLVVHTLSPRSLPQSGFFLAFGVFALSSVLASNFFPRLFGGGSDALERKILGDSFEYQDKIQGFILALPWYTDTQSLMDDFDELMVKTVRVKNYSIVLLDEPSRKFTVYRSYPADETGNSISLDRESQVFKYFYSTKADSLALNREIKETLANEMERKAIEKLKPFNAEFCYSFFSEDNPFGLLLMGRKSNNDPFTAHDMSLIRGVVKNMALILNQIRLKQRVLMAEEMELLGRMSRGMAHDLNNLITPVSIYVQLAQESADESDANFELLPTVARNVETIQTYIRDSLFYSNTLKPHFIMGRLDKTVERSIQLVSPQIKERNIFIVTDPFPEANVEFDTVLIQRMICNLLGNAGDASPEGSEIRVRLSRLPSTEGRRDWFRLEVMDHGSGISKENLRMVFQPYFTTKDRGSGKRGFGLGLAICKKIVLLHGGYLNLESEEKKGTTVIVDLPSHVEKAVETTNPLLLHAQTE